MTTTRPVLSTTEFAEQYIEILEPLEAIVTLHFRERPELHDQDVLRVYEALIKHYRARLTNFPLPQHNLEGISREIYTKHFKFLEEKESTYSLQELQECLKFLKKSVEFWNRERGSRGYLNFIVDFC